MKVKSVCFIIIGILLGGGVFLGSRVLALTYQNTTNVSFAFEPTVTIALSGNNGGGTNLIIDDLAPGSVADSNIITITAGTNSGVGFNLTASAGSSDSSSAYYNSNALKTSTGNNTMASLTSTAANLNAITAGQWGYSYSIDSGTNWVSGSTGSTATGYNGLPAINGTAITLASPSTNTTSSIQFKIAAKADTSQVSGTYSNVVNFTATVKPITTNYTITYYDGDTAMSTPVPVTGSISSGNTFSLSLNNDASQTGYTLDGWCYGTLTNGACSGTVYQPGETYVVGNIGGTATINLYAMWRSSGGSSGGGGSSSAIGYCATEEAEYCMQSVTDWESNIEVGDEVTAMDARDGKEYTVARLADGNIWMTQNLDHDIVSTTDFYTYDNTDIGHGSTLNTSATWTGTATYGTDDTTWSGSYTAPESYDPGNVCWLGEGEYDYNDTCADTHYHLGNYYNWTAAVAMSNSSSYTSNGTDVDQSICPAGWMLPKGGSNTGSGSFYNLVSQYDWSNDSYMMEGSYSMWGSPLYFPLSGGWYGSLYDMGTYGSFWSSVVYGSDGAYSLYFTIGGDVYPDGYGDRDYGYSVRCVARSS